MRTPGRPSAAPSPRSGRFWDVKRFEKSIFSLSGNNAAGGPFLQRNQRCRGVFLGPRPGGTSEAFKPFVGILTFAVTGRSDGLRDQRVQMRGYDFAQALSIALSAVKAALAPERLTRRRMVRATIARVPANHVREA